MEDSEIISLFFARSEQAVAELDRQYGAVKKTASNILPDRLDAEECVNDTYLRVWNSIPPQRPNPLVSFVCKIARNLALDRYRSSRAEKRNGSLDLVLDEMEDCIPSTMNVETELEAPPSPARTAFSSSGATGTGTRSRISPHRRTAAPTASRCVFSACGRNSETP